MEGNIGSLPAWGLASFDSVIVSLQKVSGTVKLAFDRAGLQDHRCAIGVGKGDLGFGTYLFQPFFGAN